MWRTKKCTLCESNRSHSLQPWVHRHKGINTSPPVSNKHGKVWRSFLFQIFLQIHLRPFMWLYHISTFFCSTPFMSFASPLLIPRVSSDEPLTYCSLLQSLVSRISKNWWEFNLINIHQEDCRLLKEFSYK